MSTSTVMFCLREYWLIRDSDGTYLDSVLVAPMFTTLEFAIKAAKDVPKCNVITKEQVDDDGHWHVIKDYNVDGEVIEIEEYLIDQRQ